MYQEYLTADLELCQPCCQQKRNSFGMLEVNLTNLYVCAYILISEASSSLGPDCIHISVLEQLRKHHQLPFRPLFLVEAEEKVLTGRIQPELPSPVRAFLSLFLEGLSNRATDRLDVVGWMDTMPPQILPGEHESDEASKIRASVTTRFHLLMLLMLLLVYK